MRELKINPSKVFDRLDEDLPDDFIIAHHPDLLREAEAARYSAPGEPVQKAILSLLHV